MPTFVSEGATCSVKLGKEDINLDHDFNVSNIYGFNWKQTAFETCFDSLDSPIFPIVAMAKIQLNFKRNTKVFHELRSLDATF